ncbi:MAG: O-acetyl-ADP-ribose deacetylase [Bacteroidetes bacterium GWF2_41_31]|nr:MAG: O-acetyl-ADP-ribose deacetylase [Bacteroidetes bacterium GWF2_41_31]OFZ06842.1 MAG: O-acetyl-ADP-ribose deacetylase [Bacteroidetes bacterium RIFOXYB12_FULL_41_6]
MHHNAKIELIKGDITKIEADAIVNAANATLMGGGGVDGAIHRAGGPAILEDCRKIVAARGRCETGNAFITTAGNLKAGFVIHAVGPVWHGGNQDEAKKLASCYRNSLRLASENHCKSIAFPCISTGIYGYPKKEAGQVAVQTLLHALVQFPEIEKVILVSFDEENYQHLSHQLNLLK